MIYLIITIFLDIISSVFISTTYQNINIMFPLVIVGSIPVFHNLVKNRKLFFIQIIVLGFIYDTLFSDIFLVNTYYFILYSLYIYIYYENHKPSIINIFLISIISYIYCFLLHSQ